MSKTLWVLPAVKALPVLTSGLRDYYEQCADRTRCVSRVLAVEQAGGSASQGRHR